MIRKGGGIKKRDGGGNSVLEGDRSDENERRELWDFEWDFI